MVKKYKKKPVVVEAIQFNGYNAIEISRFVGTIHCHVDPNGEFFINTLKGTMRASKGDYIIKGIKGEFYPCKPDIFENTYGDAWENEIPTDALISALAKLFKYLSPVPPKGEAKAIRIHSIPDDGAYSQYIEGLTDNETEALSDFIKEAGQ